MAITQATPKIEAYDLHKMRTFPVPTRWFSEVVVRPPTELRIALTVARHTLGWQAGRSPHLRRASVTMTHHQLKACAGCRSAAAISKALGGLVREGLLEIITDQGEMLWTAAERRRYHKPLGFRLPIAYVEEHRKTGEGSAAVDNSVEKPNPQFRKEHGVWRLTAYAKSKNI